VLTCFFVKFMHFSNDLAYGKLSVAGTPLSLSHKGSVTIARSLAAATKIVVLTTHPYSRSFKIYSCTWSSSLLPSSRGCPLFFKGILMTSSYSSISLFFCFSFPHRALNLRAVLSLSGWPNFLENLPAASEGPTCPASLPISALFLCE